ncbi:hypothetical protein [Nonomuraea dietziae]|uniref:hypothetical protein n=1 Tax=Nonomuraea dietziae TaxID=65515 RepID=UPI0033F531F5
MAVPPDLADPPDLRVHFEQIFNAHFAEIHRYIARRLSDDTADDLAAEVFLAGAEGLAQETVMHYQAWAPEAGWTDERPERPGGCRLSDRPIP